MRTIITALLLLTCAACATTPTASTTGTFVTPVPAPDFTLTALNGGSLTLSTMRGRWVILNFWATWCAPCGVEMPALQTISNERSGEIALFGVNLRESDEEIRSFMSRYRINFPILTGIDDNTYAAYNVEVGVPQTVIISPDGEIVWRQYGPIDLDSFRETLDTLKEGAAQD